MQQITIESELVQRLGSVSGQAVVRDAEGHVLGFFSPLKNRPSLGDLQLEPPLSIAETEKLRQANRTGKRLEEILARLGY